MNEDRIRWDAAEMSALLEQMWTALEQIGISAAAGGDDLLHGKRGGDRKDLRKV